MIEKCEHKFGKPKLSVLIEKENESYVKFYDMHCTIMGTRTIEKKINISTRKCKTCGYSESEKI